MLPGLATRKKGLLIFAGLLALLAGTTLITMELAFEKGRVVVPHVVGAPAPLAMERLKEQGLRGRIVGERYHPSLPKGSVIVQDPAPGSRIKPQRSVSLTLSRGSSELFLPDFTYLRKDAARRAMGAKGLALGELCHVHSDLVPRGGIVSQSPPAGTRLHIGDVVNLLVSLGPEEAVYLMPDLTGRDTPATSRTLTAMGFKVQPDFGAPSKKEPARIVAQEPLPGSPLPNGAKILLVVGKGSRR